MAVTDLLTVEVWTLKGIVRYHVLFIMRLKTREVHLAGVSASCNGLWMEQIARNLTDAMDGVLFGFKYLIHDRDPFFATSFQGILKDAGVNSVIAPRRSPNLNTFCERFVRSMKHECLDQMIFVGERSLRYTIAEYLEHYHIRNGIIRDSRVRSYVLSSRTTATEARSQVGDASKECLVTTTATQRDEKKA